MRVPDRGRWMSNMSRSSPTEDDLSARRRDDLGRDLELLLERLAESREAIVRLLAAGSAGEETVATEAPGDEETVAEEAWRDNETPDPPAVGALRPLRSAIARPAEAEVVPPLEPGATSPQAVAAEAPGPQPGADLASLSAPQLPPQARTARVGACSHLS